MDFSNPNARIIVPDGTAPVQALARTTHLGIAAHPDDLELVAVEGILACYGARQPGFTGVVLTDGAGSARGGAFAGMSDEEMRLQRMSEQVRAALLGRYSAVVMLNHPSAAVQRQPNQDLLEDLLQVLFVAHPQAVYTHDPADPHPTHAAAARAAIEALRRLPSAERPGRFLGVEVWRGLDWLPADERVVLDLSRRAGLQERLLAAFESQAAGKDVLRAAMGRRRANAAGLDPRRAGTVKLASFAMDLAPLLQEGSPGLAEFLRGKVERFGGEMAGREGE